MPFYNMCSSMMLGSMFAGITRSPSKEVSVNMNGIQCIQYSTCWARTFVYREASPSLNVSADTICVLQLALASLYLYTVATIRCDLHSGMLIYCCRHIMQCSLPAIAPLIGCGTLGIMAASSRSSLGTISTCNSQSSLEPSTCQNEYTGATRGNITHNINSIARVASQSATGHAPVCLTKKSKISVLVMAAAMSFLCSVRLLFSSEWFQDLSVSSKMNISQACLHVPSC